MKKRMTKALVLFAGAGMMFQSLGSCTDLALRETVVGFGRGVGSLPANIFTDFISPFIDDFIPTNGDDNG